VPTVYLHTLSSSCVLMIARQQNVAGCLQDFKPMMSRVVGTKIEEIFITVDN
jgi:hypothetical protein